VRVVVLGTGTSHGVPAIGCRCAVCTSPDPRDRRTRVSVAVRWRDRSLLIDTAPEFRLQAIRSDLRRVDAVLYTHSHADHIFGLDDLRRFNEMQDGEMPIYGTAATLDDLRRSFRYVFVPTQAGGGKPKLDLRTLVAGSYEIAGLPVEAIQVFHGELEVLAYRFGDFAYVTDVSRIPEASMERLRGLHTLILGALRWEPHPTHFSVEQALEVAAELQPARTFFTHIAHNLGHAEVERGLPPSVRLAYDGLVLNVSETDDAAPRDL
jgi:phosphoribosyl 1,2-cyclic phosphate phosphodiesterase